MSLFLSSLLKMSSQAPLRHINVVLLHSETRHRTFLPPKNHYSYAFYCLSSFLLFLRNVNLKN